MPHRIHVDEQLKPFPYEEADELNVLDCLEKKGIEMHSHCRAGICGTCRVKLLRGVVKYPAGPPLAYVREGEILPCCCEPVTDIEIRTY
ncbi:class I ribonucleotide reductase maintenance protein YfaE [Pontiella agarivorans]|uniref:Class I ribonucleotide reductase maintenance protein YfaE n=1 Tax=Pontiella agarivorans TaxID=3038953 RepID=A0ABU5MVN7_9BACT|nr:class I ribonucleotide reductase maintenance protein YfaE [Pontiella agarivorans]MDZ8118274.1 class I ribonucleotide reductase maintenance protein YfaE [Pontiella agarivorans]